MPDEIYDRVVRNVHHAQHATVRDDTEDLFANDLRRHRRTPKGVQSLPRGGLAGHPEVGDLEVGC